ncbi:unnamed protein product [Symbiodinium sp. CCMP2592]|nr:unnamed protein product [Symbiodinium sp. CCMP2592]
MPATPKWPACAFSREDAERFCEMLAAAHGPAYVDDTLNDVLQKLFLKALKDYEMDENTSNGGLQSSLWQIRDCQSLEMLPSLCQNIHDMKIAKESEVNKSNPTKAVEISGKQKAGNYYLSTTVNGRGCNCAVKFGGEKWKETQDSSVRPCEATMEGLAMQRWVVDKLLKKESWYKENKSFNIFMNRYSYATDHAISMHTDASKYYDEIDPITSLSMVLGSFLLIQAKQAKKRGNKPRWCLVVYQPPGSMLIMAGKFQSQFEHAVPAWLDMKEIAHAEQNAEFQLKRGGQQETLRLLFVGQAKQQMKDEIERLESLNLNETHRWNVTVRWIRRHNEDCPCRGKKVELVGTEMLKPPGKARTHEGSAGSSAKLPWDAKAAAHQRQEFNKGRPGSDVRKENDGERPSLFAEPALVATLEMAIDMITVEPWPLFSASFCGDSGVRQARYKGIEEQIASLLEIDASLKEMVDKNKMYPQQSLSVQRKIVEKLRKLRRQAVLLDLLWLSTEGPSFVAAIDQVAVEVPGKDPKHLTVVQMSFRMFKLLLDEHPIDEDCLQEHGLVCLDFSGLRDDVLSQSAKDKKWDWISLQGKYCIESFTAYVFDDSAPSDSISIRTKLTFLQQPLGAVVRMAESESGPEVSMTSAMRLEKWFDLYLEQIWTHESSQQAMSPDGRLILWMIPLQTRLTYLGSKRAKTT